MNRMLNEAASGNGAMAIFFHCARACAFSLSVHAFCVIHKPQQLDAYLKHVLCTSLALAASLAACAPGSTDDAKAVQGKWKPASAELAGQPMTEAVLKTISLKLDNGKYEIFVGG